MFTRCLLSLVSALSVFCLLPALGAPDWVPDPENSRWIVLGEKAESHGVFQLDRTSEGMVRPATRGGRACFEVVPTPKEEGGGGGRYWYFHVGDWKEWSAWIGEKDVELTFVYFDGRPARIHLSYDSSDPKVTPVPQHPGAWRSPEDLADGFLILTGSNEWKSRTIALPMVLFQKRCNGGDFRFGPVPADSDFALAGAAVTRVPRRATVEARVERVDLPVGFVRSEGAVIEGRRVRFPGKYVQEPGKPIVLEAECATTLQTDSRGDLGIDPTASDGGFVHFVLYAEYQFAVKTPGRYRLWERARFPFPGSWNHSENLDDKSAVVYDSNMGPAKVWTWVKAGQFDLAAGEHKLTLSYHGGAQLDQIVLSRDLETPPTDPLPASPNVGLTQGWAESADLKPLDVSQWIEFSAELPVKLGGEGIPLEFSTNGGRSWLPLPDSKSLTDVSAAGGGKDSLRFRVKLRTIPGSPPPFIQNAKVAYVPGPDNQVVLANDAAALTFNAIGLIGLEHRTTKHSYTRAGSQAPLFVLGVKKPGEAPLQEVSTAAASLEGYDLKAVALEKRLDLTYRLANGIVVAARVSLDAKGVSRWTVDVDNLTDLEVAELEYPILPGVRLGDEPSDDTLFFPRCWGQVWRNPVAKGLSGYYWGPHMRWMDLWDKTDGLYIGVHDDQLNDTGFGPTPDSATSLKIPVRQRILVNPRGKWSSAPRVVAFHGGDWHEGADIYRAYAAESLKEPDPAEWVKWIDLWGTQSSNDLPHKGWAVLLEDADRLEDWPPRGHGDHVQLMAANRQMMDGMDSGYCGLYLYPCIGWGSTREFAQQLAALRRRGLHYTPYMNWHLWAPGYGHYPRCGTVPWKRMPPDAPRRDDVWWQKVAARGYGGSFPRIVEDRWAQMDADIGAPEWRERLAYWTRRYLEWGADGMYYDQLNLNYFSGRLPKDYDTYGFWTRATLDTLRRIKDEARKTNPYFVSSGEVYMDSLGQALDLHMTSGVVNRLEFYAYCNPRQMFIDGGWNGGLSDGFGGYQRERFVWQVGGRFEQLLGPEPWRSQLLALRRRVKSLLYRAEFQDTVGLTIHDANGQLIAPPASREVGGAEIAPYDGIIGRWFLFREGRQRAALVNLINTPLADLATCSIRTRDFGPVQAAWAFLFDNPKPVRVVGKQQGDVYTFAVPKSEMATVILVNRLGPLIEWSAGPPVAPGQASVTEITLTNLEPASVTAGVTLRTPKGWPLHRPALVLLRPGETSGTCLAVDKVPTSTKVGRYDLHAEVKTPAETFTAYSMLSVVQPITVEFGGHPGCYYLRIENDWVKTVKGTIAVSAPPPLRASAPARFEVPVLATVKIPVTVTGQDTLVEISEMTAKVVGGGVTWNLVRGVIPIVPNGDFEIDTAGDMKPDWWMGRGLGDEWDYDRLRLDTGAPSARFCLKVEPSGNPKGFVRAYSEHGAVKPNTKYRFSAWVKRADPNGEVYVAFSGFDWRRLAPKSIGQWEHLQGEFTTGPSHGEMSVHCFNSSRGAAWFDGIVVEQGLAATGTD